MPHRDSNLAKFDVTGEENLQWRMLPSLREYHRASGWLARLGQQTLCPTGRLAAPPETRGVRPFQMALLS
jgi:hypothetical protein